MGVTHRGARAAPQLPGYRGRQIPPPNWEVPWLIVSVKRINRQLRDVGRNLVADVAGV
jgi:hypothetical protein